MKRIFDFRFAGKKTMPIMLPDGRELSLIMPTKATLEQFYAKHGEFAARVKAAKTVDELKSIIAEMYEMAAVLLSANTAGEDFTGEQLRKLDFPEESLPAFFNAWTEFTLDVENSKN